MAPYAQRQQGFIAPAIKAVSSSKLSGLVSASQISGTSGWELKLPAVRSWTSAYMK